MSDSVAKAAARRRVAQLVQQFRRNHSDYLRSSYNETQARTDFITPLLGAFGWDVYNAKGQTLAFREVIEEPTVEGDDQNASRKPDYELRLARQRKLFVEAKKPNVRIDRDRASAFQARRYGYSGSLPITILTNFHQLVVYDCLHPPSDTDAAHVARIGLFSYEEFEANFDELWATLSREVVYSGEFDQRFAVNVSRHGADQFDDYFLKQVRSWRYRLAADIHANNPGLSATELTYAVQLFLSRIVFLRICEDRELEKYETLKNLGAADTFAALMDVLKRADDFYDSGLFRLMDDARLGVRISDETLYAIISELYYPQSPYTFAVVETEVLGEIYEQFLAEAIHVSTSGTVEVVSKPEARESGGVVPTPRYIVDEIVSRTLAPLVAGKSPAELAGFTVADICCGSGVFLLSAFELLGDHYLTWYLNNDPTTHVGRTVYEAVAGQWLLTFDEKRRILLEHIRGVDIDANAVEVARFSLLLKLIEDESANDLRDYVARARVPALPPLEGGITSGNSLLSTGEWTRFQASMTAALRQRLNPLAWDEEFPTEMSSGGFDAIVGNPPYIRIQNMASYSPEEVAYYQHAASPFTTARRDNFDKYALFIERSLTLVKPQGRIGVIVPHKFMSIHAGRALRALLTEGKFLDQIVHFGVKQVFGPGTSNYTCILIMERRGTDQVRLEQPGSLQRWRYGEPGTTNVIPITELTGDPWRFATAETQALFARVRDAGHPPLDSVAEILVGVQTSADAVYIVHPIREDAETVTLEWQGREWSFEREVLRPCLHDVSLPAYARPIPNAWLIFPYELQVNAQGRLQAHLIQPDTFQARFPHCWAYLSARRGQLEGRNIIGGSAAERQWYQFGRSQSLTKFDTPKIILPVLSLEPRYSYDDRNIFITAGGNGPYYMIRPRPGLSMYYLLAVLHHPLIEGFIRTNTSPFRGGYYSHGKQFIRDLPIPLPSQTLAERIEDAVQTLVQRLDELRDSRVPAERLAIQRHCLDLRMQVEELVSLAFGLSLADVEVARAVPIPE